MNSQFGLGVLDIWSRSSFSIGLQLQVATASFLDRGRCQMSTLLQPSTLFYLILF